MAATSPMSPQSIAIAVGGQTITFETGKIARQASGAVLVRSGETVLLTTACMGSVPPEADFLPLRIDYREKFSSAGKTLKGFIKREGKPSERETLLCRLIDRPLRPLFEKGFYNEVQVITTVLSYDKVRDPDPLAICAASAALTISEIPLIKPIGAVRVAMVDDRFLINPTLEEMGRSTLDLILAGTEDGISMVEGYAHFLEEETIMAGIAEGHKAIRTICQKLAEWGRVVGKPKNREDIREVPQALFEEVDAIARDPLNTAIRIGEKRKREEALQAIERGLLDTLVEGDRGRYSATEVKIATKERISHHIRQMILEEKRRCDGRTPEDIRPIQIDMGPLPRTHGSAIFTRGDTQTIAICTLGGEGMGQRFENLDDEGVQRFYLQYHFPPFCVGEVGRTGPAGRREIGHGKLAERALAAAIPKKEKFPYTIRLESNITESNGSSSMASVCGGSLALMEGGVPIKCPIAGIAMGLILAKKSDYAILSDILGIEDSVGDMDFKIAGDERGITAFQLDTKVEGITQEIMRAALAQAKRGRIHILHAMLTVSPKPKAHLSSHAPRIETMRIKPSQIATIIGPGGKQIRAITEETGVDIDIENDGFINISSASREGLERARQIIHTLTAEIEVGNVYEGKIAAVKDFGLFVSIFKKQGLCHISELSHAPIANIHDLYKEGESIEVKVLDINRNGQIKLSHKVLITPPEN